MQAGQSLLWEKSRERLREAKVRGQWVLAELFRARTHVGNFVVIRSAAALAQMAPLHLLCGDAPPNLSLSLSPCHRREVGAKKGDRQKTTISDKTVPTESQK